MRRSASRTQLPGLNIRTATDADLRSIVDHYGPGGGDGPWDPLVSIELIQRIPRRNLLVAELDGAYAGFAFWHEAWKPWYAPEVNHCARISDIHVVAMAQGKGLGRVLLRETVATIRSEGIPTVFLETSEDNVHAQSLYESEGFVRVSPCDLRYRLDSR